jgi:hypothetical protein
MSITGYISTAELVHAAKANLGISGENSNLTDNEIRQVANLIGIWTNAPVNMMNMLIVTACEFPDFFSRHHLFVED